MYLLPYIIYVDFLSIECFSQFSRVLDLSLKIFSTPFSFPFSFIHFVCNFSCFVFSFLIHIQIFVFIYLFSYFPGNSWGIEEDVLKLVFILQRITYIWCIYFEKSRRTKQKVLCDRWKGAGQIFITLSFVNVKYVTFCKPKKNT